MTINRDARHMHQELLRGHIWEAYQVLEKSLKELFEGLNEGAENRGICEGAVVDNEEISERPPNLRHEYLRKAKSNQAGLCPTCFSYEAIKLVDKSRREISELVNKLVL